MTFFLFVFLACSTEVASQMPSKIQCTDCNTMPAQCPPCRQRTQSAQFAIPARKVFVPPDCNPSLPGSAGCNGQTNCYTNIICESTDASTLSHAMQMTLPGTISDELATSHSQPMPMTQKESSSSIEATSGEDPDTVAPPVSQTDTETSSGLPETTLNGDPGTTFVSDSTSTTTTTTATSMNIATPSQSALPESTLVVNAGVTTLSPNAADAQLIGAIVGGILGFLLLLAIIVAIGMAVARSRRPPKRADVSDSGIAATPLSTQTYSHSQSQSSSQYGSAPRQVNYDAVESPFRF